MKKEDVAEENAAGEEKRTNKNAREAVEPWYQLAREAAQIVVSALALYASLKSFVEKIKKRRSNA